MTNNNEEVIITSEGENLRQSLNRAFTLDALDKIDFSFDVIDGDLKLINEANSSSVSLSQNDCLNLQQLFACLATAFEDVEENEDND